MLRRRAVEKSGQKESRTHPNTMESTTRAGANDVRFSGLLWYHGMGDTEMNETELKLQALADRVRAVEDKLLMTRIAEQIREGCPAHFTFYHLHEGTSTFYCDGLYHHKGSHFYNGTNDHNHAFKLYWE